VSGLLRVRILFTLAFTLLYGIAIARIAIYGDSRGGGNTHTDVIAAIASHKPDAVFHAGDFCERGTDQREYEDFLQAVAALGVPGSFFPARGNHERDKELFLSKFPYIGTSTWYSVTRDSIRFVILDSNASLKPDSEQYQWLEEVLQADLGMPIIVIVHHPVFSSGAHGDTPGLGLYLPPLLEKYGVSAVISGHDHAYERSEFHDIHYIVTGGGGSSLRESSHANPWSILVAVLHHYLILDREDKVLQIKAYDLNGNRFDTVSIPLD
jgi:acid phosphatase